MDGLLCVGRHALGCFEELDEWLRRRLRQVRWKEWKRIRTKHRNLAATGIPDGKAYEWANSRRGYWRIARLWVLTRSLTERLLARAGAAGIQRSLPPSPGCDANRRMRTRTSGGVGGAGVSPAPTRFSEVQLTLRREAIRRPTAKPWSGRRLGAGLAEIFQAGLRLAHQITS